MYRRRISESLMTGRQNQPKKRPVVIGLEPDVAPQTPHNFTANRQSQPRAACFALVREPGKFFKGQFVIRGRNPRSVVPKIQMHRVIHDLAADPQHLGRGVAIFGRIGHQIDDDLRQTVRIGGQNHVRVFEALDLQIAQSAPRGRLRPIQKRAQPDLLHY